LVDENFEWKWIELKEIARKSYFNVIDTLKYLRQRLSNRERELLDEIRKHAERGLFPDPEYLESLAENLKSVNIFLIAALFHREVARYLTAIMLKSGKYAEEALGAYLKSISLLLGVSMLKDDEKFLNETLRTLGELIYLADDSRVNALISKLIVVIREMIDKIFRVLSTKRDKNEWD